MLRQQLPEVPFLGIRWHASNQRQDLTLSPVVASHYKQTGGLGIRTVKIFNVPRCGLGFFVVVVSVVTGVGTSEIR